MEDPGAPASSFRDAFQLRVGKRFELGRSLGSGSFGEVFEAFDRGRSATVALKILHRPDAELVQLFKREFRSLADIRHPGLVRLYELFVGERDAFFTMEAIDGARFDVFAASVDREVDRLSPALVMLAEALSALHRSGKVHRDIKPGNVMVDRRGQVRLLDFGLAVGAASSIGPAGSLPYMAPELGGGAVADAASDVYSLGAFVYEALTGSTPTGNDKFFAAAQRKLTRSFPRPRDVRASLPEELDALVWSMLAPEPAERPSLDHLVAVCGGAPASRPPAYFRSVFVGRSAELERLDAFAGDATSRVVVVEGEAGIGKTTLVRTFLSRRAGAHWVFESRCHPQEQMPFRAFDGLVEGIVTAITAASPEDRRAILASVSHDLAIAFPGLLAVADAPRDVPLADPQERRERIAADLCAMCRAIARSRPILLWVDDAHWADRESIQLLRQVEDAVPELRIVLTRRPSRAGDDEVEAWLRTHEHVVLGTLADAEVREVLGDDVDASLLATLQGLPFLVERIGRQPGRALAASLLDDVLSQVRPSARTLLERVALLDRPVPLTWLAVDADEGTRLVEEVAWLNWERLTSLDDRDNVSIYHDLLRDAVKRSISVERHRAIHEDIVTRFERRGAGPEYRFVHYLAIERHDDAFTAAEQAGDAASSRYAFDLATEWFRRALQVDVGAARRAPLWHKLAELLAHQGAGQEAADAYAEAEACEGKTSTEIASKRALALLRCGQVKGIDAIIDVLARDGIRIPSGPVAALAQRAMDHAVIAYRRRRPARLADLPLEALWRATTTLSFYDPVRGAVAASRFVRLAMCSRDPEWRQRADGVDIVMLEAFGRWARKPARALHPRIRAYAEQDGHAGALAAGTMGSTAWFRGEFAECARWIDVSFARFAEMPGSDAFESSQLDIFRPPVHALLRGAFADPGPELKLAAARARKDRFGGLPYQHGLITLAYLAAGRVDEARARATDARETTREFGSIMGVFDGMRTDVALLLFDGRADEALARAHVGWKAVRDSGLLTLEVVEAELRYLKARAALAVIVKNGRPAGDLVDGVAGDARKLRKTTLACGGAWAASLEAQLAAATRRPDAGEKLFAARDAFAAQELELDRTTLEAALDRRTSRMTQVLFPALAEGAFS